MSKVGVDIDDVLKPWYDIAHDVCRGYGITNGVQPQTWHPYKEYGVTMELWHEAIARPTARGMSHRLYGGNPYAGAVDALLTLCENNHTIHLVTSRGTGDWPHGHSLKRTTVEWLEHYCVPYDSLTFSHDKTIVRADYFVDDNLDNYEALRASGVTAYLMTRKWNQTRDGAGRVIPDGRLRVSDMNEFLQEVLSD
jgi:uncharacterized HAD superfamily protein